jgi:hypothetical protein
LKGLEAERAKIEEEIADVRRQLNSEATARGKSTTDLVVSQPSTPTKRTMSAAARKRIPEGMKRRYPALRKAAQAGKK